MRPGWFVVLLLVGAAPTSAAALSSCGGGGGKAVGGAGASAGGGGQGGMGGGGASTTSFMIGQGGTAPLDCPDAAADADITDGGLTGCEGVEGGVVYDPTITTIFGGCFGELCHISPTQNSLVDVAATECTDGRLLVVPGNAAKSYLFDKLEGQSLCSGGRMPLGMCPLAEADMLTIRRWICEGAPD